MNNFIQSIYPSKRSIALLSLCLCLFFSFNMTAYALQSKDLTTVSESLLADIKQSQQRLNQREKKISQEKIALAKKIAVEQKSLIQLREKTAINRRLVDDGALALSQLQQRLSTWKDQDNYQKRLLLDLSERIELPIDKINLVASDNQAGLVILKDYVVAQQQALTPQWQQEKIIQPSGELVLAKVLTLGPVQWYWLDNTEQGGLLDDNGKVIFTFDEVQSAQLALLFHNEQAQITFDPTLDRALKLANESESVLEHLERGGIWAIPILLFAVFALLIALAKAWQLWRLPELMPLLAERIDMIAQTTEIIEKKSRLNALKKQLVGAEKKLVEITLANPVQAQRDDMLLAYLVESRHKLNAKLGAIAITAAVSPLLGLLGTVSGMIETFQMMTLFGAGDPAVVSGGISKALITTELGLVVAIPALILHALLSRKIKNYNTQLDTTAIRLGKLDTTA